MAVQWDASAGFTGITAGAGGVTNKAFTIGANADRYLIVHLAFYNASTTIPAGAASVKWNTTESLALLWEVTSTGASSAVRLQAWGLKNPTAGSFNVTVTNGAGTIGGGGCVAASYYNVHQTTPTSTAITDATSGSGWICTDNVVGAKAVASVARAWDANTASLSHLPANSVPAYSNLGLMQPLSTGTATTVTPGKPSDIIPRGNVYLAVLITKNNATHNCSTSGWTKFAQTNSGTLCTVSLWSAGPSVAAAADPVFTWTGAVAYAAQVFSYKDAKALGAALGAAGTGTTNPHTSAGANTTAAKSLAVYVDACVAATALGLPSGWTEDSDGGANACEITIGSKEVSSSGAASGAISVTGGAAAWVQRQVELMAGPAQTSRGYSLDLNSNRCMLNTFEEDGAAFNTLGWSAWTAGAGTGTPAGIIALLPAPPSYAVSFTEGDTGDASLSATAQLVASLSEGSASAATASTTGVMGCALTAGATPGVSADATVIPGSFTYTRDFTAGSTGGATAGATVVLGVSLSQGAVAAGSASATAIIPGAATAGSSSTGTTAATAIRSASLSATLSGGVVAQAAGLATGLLTCGATPGAAVSATVVTSGSVQAAGTAGVGASVQNTLPTSWGLAGTGGMAASPTVTQGVQWAAGAVGSAAISSVFAQQAAFQADGLTGVTAVASARRAGALQGDLLSTASFGTAGTVGFSQWGAAILSAFTAQASGLFDRSLSAPGASGASAMGALARQANWTAGSTSGASASSKVTQGCALSADTTSTMAVTSGLVKTGSVTGAATSGFALDAEIVATPPGFVQASAAGASAMSSKLVAVARIGGAGGWDMTGAYVLSTEYLGSFYVTPLNLVQDASGNLTGTGGSAPYTWTLTSGSVSGNAFEFYATYDIYGYHQHHVGTIAPDGKLSGTWTDDAGGVRTGTFTTTTGAASLVPPGGTNAQGSDTFAATARMATLWTAPATGGLTAQALRSTNTVLTYPAGSAATAVSTGVWPRGWTQGAAGGFAASAKVTSTGLVQGDATSGASFGATVVARAQLAMDGAGGATAERALTSRGSWAAGSTGTMGTSATGAFNRSLAVGSVGGMTANRLAGANEDLLADGLAGATFAARVVLGVQWSAAAVAAGLSDSKPPVTETGGFVVAAGGTMDVSATVTRSGTIEAALLSVDAFVCGTAAAAWVAVDALGTMPAEPAAGGISGARVQIDMVSDVRLYTGGVAATHMDLAGSGGFAVLDFMRLDSAPGSPGWIAAGGDAFVSTGGPTVLPASEPAPVWADPAEPDQWDADGAPDQWTADS